MKTGFCRVHDIKYPPVLVRTSDMQFIHPHGVTQVDYNCIPRPGELLDFLWRRYVMSLVWRIRFALRDWHYR